MFGRDSKSNARIDTLVGKSAKVAGDVEFTGGLHLDGRVAGNVRADNDPTATLSVSETGSIEGSVEVPTVVLNGVGPRGHPGPGPGGARRHGQGAGKCPIRRHRDDAGG